MIIKGIVSEKREKGGYVAQVKSQMEWISWRGKSEKESSLPPRRKGLLNDGKTG